MVRLTQGDACGDAFFWAATENGDTAVVVAVEAPPRSQSVPTTYPLGGANLAQVTVLHGTHLDRNFCTDVIDGNSQPTKTQKAMGGTGEITLGPSPRQAGGGCGTTAGSLTIAGLVAEDGTRFAPILVDSPNIGCYSG